VSGPGGIDGGIFVGRDEATGRAAALDVQLQRLADMGADRALAIASRAIRFDWREGNADLLAQAKADPRLVPVANVNLPGYAPGEGLARHLRAQGFAAVALVSDAMGWGLHGPALRALAIEAAEARLPLMLCAQTAADFQGVGAAAAVGGPVLLRWMRAHAYFRLADMIALMRDHPALMLEVGSQSQTGAIADLVSRVGDDRLFIASGDPQAHAGPGWFMLVAADLDADAKLRIAGGNLARVLGLAAPQRYRVPTAYAVLQAAPKIDTHWHTSSWNLIETKTSFADLKALADRAGIATYISSSVRALSDDLEAGNAETKALLDFDARARGMIVVNPLRFEASLAEIERYSGDPRFVGIKTIQDFYGLDLDAEPYRALFAALGSRSDFPIMAHLPGLKAAATRFPHLRFVAAHSTWNHRDLVACPNVWFDIATSSPRAAEADIADLVAIAGPARVLFSSDAPLIDPAWTMGKLACAGLSPEALETIFVRSVRAAFPRLAT
jgi:predicted TIM-barrel fold metal-dependent hydrolase